MKAITHYLQQRGFGCVQEEHYGRIALWQKWYTGYVPAFHNYRQYNGRRRLCRTRKSLGMGKTIAEDWASLALNEKVGITAADGAAQEKLWRVLNANQFRVRGNQLLEMTFALGTGAFVERTDGGAIRIDYIRAGMIYPLSWDNLQVTECAFASERITHREKQVYLNMHRLENGKYVIENHLFRRNGETLTEIAFSDGTKPEIKTGSAIPRFQLIRPNIANNLDPDCPMGISVYANALDQLEGLDLVYDSYCNEFRLGKKRITVPVTMARAALEEDGVIAPVFDDNDTEFFALPAMDGGENKITEHNMELRYEAHEAGIQTALNLLSFKCGMGKDRYNFDDHQVKTATEVISEKSELFQSLKKHELLLEDALLGLSRAILDMLGFSAETEISVSFDDSVIADSETARATDRQDVRDGLMAKWEYRVKWYGEDKATAMRSAASLEAEPGLTFGSGEL